MSLNGLDSAKVSEAYQSALAEAGGWFLLKYVSRDAIEILTRGTGGLVEARGAVAQYSEKSPLYGFLLYRRRKVLIKYIPEGTSRLLQARVSVHFQALAEKFSPHDTIFSISSADDLNDATLTAACSLHTATPSSSCSSSGSSRRHKLDEITEDAEEGQGSTADDTSSIARPMTAASTIPTILELSSSDSKVEAKSENSEPSTIRTSIDHRPKTPRAETSVSQVSVEAALEPATSTTLDYRATLKDYEKLFENNGEPRLSSQTARPSTSDLYNSIYYEYSKPKVKLGPRPRPSIDGGKRPHTSGTGSRDDARPVSQLPAGLRVAQRKTNTKRPKSRDSSVVPSIAFPPPPPIPNIPETALITPMRPTSSPASIRSLPARSPGMTPEKQRLMKALEIRKRQLSARKKEDEKEAKEALEEAIVEAPVVIVKHEIPVGKEYTVTNTTAQEEVKEQEQPDIAGEARIEDFPLPLADHSKADSGVEIVENGHSVAEDQQSSASASSPTSAQTQISSDSPSTRPSSISEEEDHTDPIPEMKIATLQHSSIVENKEIIDTPEAHEAVEEESVESSPTVVPEKASPVPSIEVNATPYTHPDDRTEETEQNPPCAEIQPEFLEVSPAPISMSKRRSTVEVREKRRALMEPIQVELNAEQSDEYLSDDSFMEELQSAKFEQAKPISVSKSPITPYFSRKSSTSAVTIPERSSSNQFNPTPGRLSPEQLGGDRASSGSWLSRPNQENMTIAKKINVSSGISQRIKALAEKSNRESTASISPIATSDASISIVTQRKSSFRTPPNGPSPVSQHTKRFSRSSFASFTSPSPDRQTLIQPQDGLHTVYNIQQQHDKPESVQVTARIIRDSRTQKPNLAMPTDNSPLELHQSPIIIDHQKATSVSMSSSKVNLSRPEPTSPVAITSSPPSRDTSSSALPRSSSESSWRSLGRRMSEAKPPPPSMSIRSYSANSLDSLEEKKDDKKDKKDSRTSRLFKRMSSSISSTSRKQALSATVKEEEDLASSLPSLREPPPAVQVGDLNVQFPDTLLWKRRWVEIDSMGNIVLSLSKANEHPRGITKRYHLSEFRTPYAPDQDRQELPNSVILDFLDGRTLQCACETYVSQVNVLQILREAHEAWMAYGQ
ncbi:hypothetical protein K432DRAFT_406146 [Lepidopterella palustris CBS 459.81]|uniref:ADF-H domain-containing protein n=1 Tax=Lepidopterella palustris CBS 459.81 TaxID=1314670 RepID=A0A8E2E7J7_9PEZI|nr:hypothetical protein K432DRAFT_406146 [Lepidopterella palustris CBS 459.81]